MEATFKPGDQVVLKSGGRLMTVEGYDAAGMVRCVYSNEMNEIQHVTLAEVTLRAYVPSTPAVSNPSRPTITQKARRLFGDSGR